MAKGKPRHRGQPSLLKSPVAVLAASSTKEPKATPGLEPMRLQPAWRISLMEMFSPFGWRQIEPEKLVEVRAKLRDFESMTWYEILVTAKDRNHAVSVSKLCKEARDRLEEIDQGDLDELVSLRLSGAERVWGIRTGNVFHVLWWDPTHAVCPSPKKHT
jgi:hypothetical protein